MKEKGKSKAGGILAIIFLGVLVLSYIVTAVLSLVKLGFAEKITSNFTDTPAKGTYVEGYFHLGTELVLTMKHTINLIPSGNEYYFAVFNDSFDRMLFVRADKKFADNFPTTGESTDTFFRYNESGTTVKGRMKKMDYKEKKELAQFISDAQADGVNTISSGNDILFLDATVKRISILKLIFGGCLVGAFLLFIYISSVTNKEKQAASGISPDMMPKQSFLDMELGGTMQQTGQTAANQQAFQPTQENSFGMYNELQPANTTTPAVNKKVKGPKDIAAIISIVLFLAGMVGILYTLNFW